MKKQSTRGFTLIEMMVVIGLIGILAGVVFPYLFSLERKQKLKRDARTLVANLSRARGLAVTGSAGITATQNAWAERDRTRNAGIWIMSDRQYTIFVDNNTDLDNTEVIIGTVDLAQHADGFVRFQNLTSFPLEIRFRENGTVATPIDLTLLDTSVNDTRIVRVTGGGLARVQ
jgi:prepilin-type N-terminal cleavage/methylation domain-containing protein